LDQDTVVIFIVAAFIAAFFTLRLGKTAQ